MSQILKDAIQLKRDLKLSDYKIDNIEVQQIENRIDGELSTDLPNSHKKIQALVKRLKKYRNHLLTFLYRPKVPPDNNSSERAIRNLKIKNKYRGASDPKTGLTSLLYCVRLSIPLAKTRLMFLMPSTLLLVYRLSSYKMSIKPKSFRIQPPPAQTDQAVDQWHFLLFQKSFPSLIANRSPLLFFEHYQ